MCAALLARSSRIACSFARASHSATAVAASSRACIPLLLLPLLLSSTRGILGADLPPPPPLAAAAAAAARTGPVAFISGRAGRRPPPRSNSSLFEPDLDMAWECSGFSNRELLSNLQKGRIIKTPRVFEAMLAVDRALFVPGGHLSPAVAYQDAPHPIGHGATISAPHMHAMCLELLADRLVPGATALDVGSGSGYLVACMAEMVTPKKTMKASEQHEGKGGEVAGASAAASGGSAGAASSSAGPSVFGIEHIGALVAASKKSLAAWDPSYEQRIQVVQGDGRLGFPGHQYDAIHVGAAAATIPQALLDQLKPGGRLVIPVGPEGGDQHLDAIDKDLQGKVTRMRVTGVRYVPLTSEEHQVKNAL